MTPQTEPPLLKKKKSFLAPHPLTNRSNKFPYFRALFLLLALFSFYGAWSIGRLRAEESSQKNFTTIRPEEMGQLENLHERADSLMGQKNFRGAIDVYSEILLIEPDDDAAYTNMAQAYMVLGDFKQAGNAFENALHINPDNDIAKSGLRKIMDPDFSSTAGISTSMPPTTVTSAPKLAALPVAQVPPTAIPQSISPPAKPLTHQTGTPAKVMTTPSAAAQPMALNQPPPASPVDPDLERNTHLTFNQWSQIALKKAGFYRGPIDGKLSKSMKNAVETFQQKNHLETDGMVGPMTWARLKHYLTNEQLAQFSNR